MESENSKFLIAVNYENILMGGLFPVTILYILFFKYLKLTLLKTLC